MECDAPVDNGRFWFQHGHPVVHFFVHEPEGERFVSYQRLVVRLRIRNMLFSVPPVDQGMHDLPNVPFIILHMTGHNQLEQ